MFALIKPPVDPWSLLLFLCVFRFISDQPAVVLQKESLTARARAARRFEANEVPTFGLTAELSHAFCQRHH